MGSFVTDLGMHALHLLLSGPSRLLLDELSLPDEEGKESTTGQVKLCNGPGVEEDEMRGDSCGARSSKVYCMEVAATDFKEADMVQHTLGSTCAPGGMRSVHDKLYSDYCFRRFPATRSVYFSDERCSLLPGVKCGPL
ncbi:g10081 [Coccomyxa elongata]